MEKEDKYPLFMPPGDLVNTGRENWNAKEAASYQDWLLGVFPKRVNELLLRFEEPRGAKPSEHLMALGEKVERLLKEAPFSEESSTGKRLTNLGYALAADMGLLVADYLLKALPDNLSWKIIRKPKSELSYNLPVLEGFSFNYLEPIGGSVAEAFGILRGNKSADIWKNSYEFWVKNI